MLSPDRHNRGWPRLSLLMRTSQSDQSFRLYVHACGTVDGHDARGSSWEVIQFEPIRPESGPRARGHRPPPLPSLAAVSRSPVSARRRVMPVLGRPRASYATRTALSTIRAMAHAERHHHATAAIGRGRAAPHAARSGGGSNAPRYAISVRRLGSAPKRIPGDRRHDRDQAARPGCRDGSRRASRNRAAIAARLSTGLGGQPLPRYARLSVRTFTNRRAVFVVSLSSLASDRKDRQNRARGGRFSYSEFGPCI